MFEFCTSRDGAFVFSAGRLTIVSSSVARNFVLDCPAFSLTMTRSIIALLWGQSIGWKRIKP
jgi:hypothetical protein